MPGPAKIMAGNWRWFICGLLFLATTLNYMDRQVLGLLAPELQRAIGWSETQYAHIIVAFQAAYALGLLAFGRIIDRLGTRRGYALAVVLWSVAAAGHALAASVTGFGVARFALGLGEAAMLPHLDRLSDRELLERTERSNGEVPVFALTGAGLRLREVLVENWRVLEHALFDDLRKKNRRLLKKALRRFTELLRL